MAKCYQLTSLPFKGLTMPNSALSNCIKIAENTLPRTLL